MHVLIIYASDYGNTKKMAEKVAQGAKSGGASKAVITEALEVTAEALLEADAVIIGSPVHMGSLDWRIKKFIDQVCSGLWMKDALVGKVGGVFASGGGFGGGGGGCELTLLAMMSNLAELGIIMVPLPKNTPGYSAGGIQWGPYGRSGGVHMEQNGVTAESLEVAFAHGLHITRVAARLKGCEIFTGQKALNRG